VDFVCEEDVKHALTKGEKIYINEKRSSRRPPAIWAMKVSEPANL